jgi:coenzyme F420 biosynthesis associated uncharacterized protein
MIDWVIAAWIAERVAGPGPDSTVADIDLQELAALSEARVVAYTGLRPAAPLPPPEGVGRRSWIEANLATTRLLMDPVLEKAQRSACSLKPLLQIGAGFVVSLEVGVLVGYLAQRVLGQYELVLLERPAEPRPPRLLFVLPNLSQAVERFDADGREFMTWVALHEVTHAVQFGGVPWLKTHMSGLVSELLASAEVRLDRTAGPRFALPSREEISRRLAAIRRGDLLGVVTSPQERAIIDRVQAVMAVIEGHAEHVMDAVARDLLPSLERLRGALDDRRRTQSRLNRLVGRLLGMEMKLRQYERGKIFCDAVVAAAGPEGLTRVFDSPESLPTLEEIEDPAAWLERMGLAREP